jgi:hypothetical protein
MAQARLAERDQRRIDRLVRAALRAQRHARGRRHQHEACILIAGVIERIEAAGDEGIVDGADREQPFAEDVSSKAQRRQHEEQIVLGDAQLDMLAGIGCAPFLRGRDFGGGEDVGEPLAAEEAALVHPGSEVGRDGHVRRGGDDSVRERTARTGKIEQDAPERRLSGLFLA